MIVGLGSIIALLVIMLIFFVLRGQNMQRELALTRQSAKTNAKKVNYAYTSLVVVTNNLQQIFVSRVEKAHQRALISEDQYGILSILASQYSRVVMDCCEKEATVEEALKKSLKKTAVTIEEVNAEAKTLKGSFYFNAYDSTGTKYLNFSEGVFYNLSYTE